MRSRLLMAAGTLLAVGIAMPGSAGAQNSFGFSFNGPGVGGTLTLNYGPATDAKYPGAFEITSVGGTFFDTNNGLNITNAPAGSLVAVTHDTPEPTNVLAPHDFSRFAVASGLPAQSNGFATYDNLFWPGGSPQTASDYPFHGGFLDIYGLMFNAGNGRVVNIWSNGFGPTGTLDYGFSISTAATSLDYVGGGVMTASTIPEPGTLWLVGSGLLGVFALRRRTAFR